MRYPNLFEVSWHKEFLPDFLWIAFMLGERSDPRAVYAPLDVLDRFVADEARVVDGRITRFALVPAARREEARLALRTETPGALPGVFGHVLGLFPDCPASWLYDGHDSQVEPDPEIALPILRSLVSANADKSSVSATRLRMAAYCRLLQHGHARLSDRSLLELLVRYPTGLSVPDQRKVEAVVRSSWMALSAAESMRYPDRETWPHAFWARCRQLAPCRSAIDKEPLPVSDEEGPLDPEALMQLSEFRAVVSALESLGDELHEMQLGIPLDEHADESSAVLLGFASRLYRLLHDFLERPSAWTPRTSELHLRPIVDARILSAWLMHRNDPGIFAAYREFGLGRLKLLREHVRADFGEQPGEDEKEFLAFLDRRVNLERHEWFQPVELGSFTRVSPWRMAEETGLSREYNLAYAPYSSENHGEWPAVRDYDTVVCDEVLHCAHRIGAFSASPRAIGAIPPMHAFNLARQGIVAIFGHFERDVAPLFDPVERALDNALFHDTDARDDGSG